MTDSTSFDPNDFDVTIERTFDAPRQRVWDAWTDPEQVAQWWVRIPIKKLAEPANAS